MIVFQYIFFLQKYFFFYESFLETQLFLGRLPGTAEAWQWRILIVPDLIFFALV